MFSESWPAILELLRWYDKSAEAREGCWACRRGSRTVAGSGGCQSPQVPWAVVGERIEWLGTARCLFSWSVSVSATVQSSQQPLRLIEAASRVDAVFARPHLPVMFAIWHASFVCLGQILFVADHSRAIKVQSSSIQGYPGYPVAMSYFFRYASTCSSEAWSLGPRGCCCNFGTGQHWLLHSLIPW